jgi:hypothetical protein
MTSQTTGAALVHRQLTESWRAATRKNHDRLHQSCVLLKGITLLKFDWLLPLN